MAGSHGNIAAHSLQPRPAPQCDWLVDVTWVDANGTVHTSAQGSDEMRGLCGGIGVFGVVAELTLQMTPTSNTLVTTLPNQDDGDLVGDINKMLAVGRGGG